MQQANYLRVTQSSAASIEPVTILEVKDHARIDRDLYEDDRRILAYITEAREAAEGYTGRRFIKQTWSYYRDDWPEGDYFELPYPPLIQVSTVQYTDCSGSTTSMTASSSYEVNASIVPGRVLLPYNETWPASTLDVNNPIKVTFQCGYGSNATSVPQSIREWITACASWRYENREADIQDFPVGALRRYKVNWF